MCQIGNMTGYSGVICGQNWNQSNMTYVENGDQSDDDIWQLYIEAVVICSVALTGILGNIFVLVDSIKLTRFMQENIYLFFSMSLSDTITCIIRCAAWVYILFHVTNDSGIVVCEIWLASSVFIAISIAMNMIIAIERYLIMCSYKTYKKMFAPKSTLILIVLVWIFVALSGTFLDKGLQFNASLHENGVSCILQSDLLSLDKTRAFVLRTVTTGLLGVFPILVTIFCYAAIVTKIWRTGLERLEKYDETFHYYRITYISLSRVALIIVCWLPYLMFISIGPLQPTFFYDYVRFFDYMLLFEAALSPFVTMHDSDFRDTTFLFNSNTCFCTKKCTKKSTKLQREGTKTSRTSFHGSIKRGSTSNAMPVESLQD